MGLRVFRHKSLKKYVANYVKVVMLVIEVWVW